MLFFRLFSFHLFLFFFQHNRHEHNTKTIDRYRHTWAKNGIEKKIVHFNVNAQPNRDNGTNNKWLCFFFRSMRSSVNTQKNDIGRKNGYADFSMEQHFDLYSKCLFVETVQKERCSRLARNIYAVLWHTTVYVPFGSTCHEEMFEVDFFCSNKTFNGILCFSKIVAWKFRFYLFISFERGHAETKVEYSEIAAYIETQIKQTNAFLIATAIFIWKRAKCDIITIISLLLYFKKEIRVCFALLHSLIYTSNLYNLCRAHTTCHTLHVVVVKHQTLNNDTAHNISSTLLIFMSTSRQNWIFAILISLRILKWYKLLHIKFKLKLTAGRRENDKFMPFKMLIYRFSSWFVALNLGLCFKLCGFSLFEMNNWRSIKGKHWRTLLEPIEKQ